ncbi:hypothetical protein DL769_004696 [Monosporascus sp. CRB-8-3]|nr:hypothetical protein DL769_004696 [Monosporascus sp. CRB-8-3]
MGKEAGSLRTTQDSPYLNASKIFKPSTPKKRHQLVESGSFAPISNITAEANLKAAIEVIRPRASFANKPQRTAASHITKPISVRAATAKYNISSPAAVDRLVKKLQNPDPRPRGRPRALTDEEDEAIVAFIIWMERSGSPASKPEIEDTANIPRLGRDQDAKPVNKMWAVEKPRTTGSAPLSAGLWAKSALGSAAGESAYNASSASGDTIPRVIFKALPSLDWAFIDADPEIRFAKSETALSNAEITLRMGTILQTSLTGGSLLQSRAAD